MPQHANGPLRSFGRMKARPIKPRQAELLETLLPRLRLDLSAGALDPAALTRGAPSVPAQVWLEIGFGGGEHLAGQAQRRPDVLMLGAAPFLHGLAGALRQIEDGGLCNVRLHDGDARDLVAALPDASLDRVFVLFPDPWPKLRHHKRRLIQAGFVAELTRVMRPGASLRFATDWADYANAALEQLSASPQLKWLAECAHDWRSPPADHIATRYQRKGLGDSAPVFLDFERTL